MYYGGGNFTRNNSQNKPLRHAFVSLMLKGYGNGFALKGGDATKGKFATMYDGPRPNTYGGHAYTPMKLQGAIILGTGGDQSNGGCMPWPIWLPSTAPHSAAIFRRPGELL